MSNALRFLCQLLQYYLNSEFLGISINIFFYQDSYYHTVNHLMLYLKKINVWKKYKQMHVAVRFIMSGSLGGYTQENRIILKEHELK